MRVPDTADGATTSSRSRPLCWASDDHAEFLGQAGDYLAEGLADGKRVCFAAPGRVEVIAEQLRAVERIGDAVSRGAVEIVSLDALYPLGTVVVPADQVRTYGAATDRALAAG